jgi:demethylphylloquinone reductase
MCLRVKVADALKLRDRLNRIKSETVGSQRVVIVGGGYIGVELACNISESLTESGCNNVQVSLLVGKKGLLVNAPLEVRTKAMHALTATGVDICYNKEVQCIEEGQIHMKTVQPQCTPLNREGNAASETVGELEHMPANLIVWTAGSQPNQLIREWFPSCTGDDGRLQVSTCQWILIIAFHHNSLRISFSFLSSHLFSNKGERGDVCEKLIECVCTG